MKNDHESNIKFVQLVEKHPELYNNKVENYGNKIHIDSVWKEIGKALDSTGEGCMDKWRTLRGGYVRYLRGKTTSDGGSDPKKEYYLAKYMKFLVPYIKFRGAKDMEEKSSAEDGHLNQKIEVYSDTAMEDNDSTSSDGSRLVIMEDSHKFNGSKENTTKCTKKLCQISETSKRKINTTAAKSNKYKRCTNQTWADLNFFKSLLPDLAILNANEKNIFKIKILTELNRLIEHSKYKLEHEEEYE